MVKDTSFIKILSYFYIFMSSTTKYGIGVMSGTSLDGVDICYVEFTTTNSYQFKIINAETFNYSETWRSTLKNAFTSDVETLKELDVIYGDYLGKLINQFIKDNHISIIDFIASHGHTIFHKPDKGYTLQIGDGQKIATITNQKVICDFRTQDVALGGQGAPLVPIGDELLFKNYEYCLNLGGFVNISFNKNGKRLAYDICPINIVLNHYVQKLGLDFDDKGQIAASGSIHQPLLEKLNNLDYYHKPQPKSLGYEWIVTVINPLIDSYTLEIKDILRTFIEHVAFQISRATDKKASILVTGGGAFNDFLMERIEFYLNTKIEIPSKEIIDFKEALIFAFLGLLKLEDKVNVLSSVTGASKDHSSGLIFNP